MRIKLAPPFLILVLSFNASFGQVETKRGTIKVQAPIDIPCTASIIGYTGEVSISKNELSKAVTVDLSDSCNCDIIETVTSFVYNKMPMKFLGCKDIYFSNLFYNSPDITRLRVIIKAKDRTTGTEFYFPSIIFNIVQ